MTMTDEQLKQAFETVMRDQQLCRIFNYWCNMLIRWELRMLHGLTDEEATEFAVLMCMITIAKRGNANEGIWVNLQRPIEFMFFDDKKVAQRAEMVIKAGNVTIQ